MDLHHPGTLVLRRRGCATCERAEGELRGGGRVCACCGGVSGCVRVCSGDEETCSAFGSKVKSAFDPLLELWKFDSKFELYAGLFSKRRRKNLLKTSKKPPKVEKTEKGFKKQFLTSFALCQAVRLCVVEVFKTVFLLCGPLGVQVGFWG